MSIELIYIGGLVLIFFAVLIFVMAKSKTGDEITATLNELKQLTSHLSNAQAEISGRISQHQSGFNERLESLSKGLNDGSTNYHAFRLKRRKYAETIRSDSIGSVKDARGRGVNVKKGRKT